MVKTGHELAGMLEANMAQRPGGQQLLKQMLPSYKKGFLHISAGDGEWRVGVRSGFDSILETYEHQK